MLVLIAACLLLASSNWELVLAASSSTRLPMTTTPEVSRLLERGCRNCHSNITEWPWYSKFPPVSWMVAKDVNKARKAMNFSEWPTYSPSRAAGMLIAACADAKSKRMPLPVYRLMHPESRWTVQETKTFCDWTVSEVRRLSAMKTTKH